MQRRETPEGLGELVTEGRNPATDDMDMLSTEEVLRRINREDQRVAPAVEKEIPHIAQAVEFIVEGFRSGGRLLYVGAGTSGRLGLLDASECPPTFSADPRQVQGVMAGGPEAVSRATESDEDSADAGRDEMGRRDVCASDVVVGIAASGRTPYVLGAMEEAERRCAKVVALTCNPETRLSEIADVTIAPVVGPEVLLGSTRLKAGTAQKMVLNMLSTTAMIRMGKVYSNLMVDLKASNAKLFDRCRRIVELATGAVPEEAAEAVEAAGYRAKVAIVMLLADVGAEEAERRLNARAGYVREAIETGNREGEGRSGS